MAAWAGNNSFCFAILYVIHVHVIIINYSVNINLIEHANELHSAFLLNSGFI